jgi:hypothetical protein
MRYFCLTAVLLILAGCESRITETELIGVYVDSFGSGNETIELRSDGTYSHIFRQPGASADVRNEGSWSMAPNEGPNRVAFKDFVFAPETSGAQLRSLSGSEQRPVLWSTTARRSWTGLRLIADADLGQYYQKAK